MSDTGAAPAQHRGRAPAHVVAHPERCGSTTPERTGPTPGALTERLENYVVHLLEQFDR
ncbi:hypothetical protein ACGF8B_23795 [Streptomyces sp. NPDC047917]|uniref:hypothetical protein n=1 Tax=Streptomyces sp. NPDC047917 TaxID=3365491 RepID=UPI00372070A9